ncbi:serine/threonine-protein phosphatase CPPED1 isoform X3 [Mirounga angustirostris]|uniref:Serine/threonine-protein phosphatase CPPED1 isoform X2 n=1 Tax=Neomonachus schauinslandi TaxID=29088 RepID=A0A8M1MB45_NEOSC|nr:serine/threonine-protein phosphatase CPPED1 isoform X3 [Mirounga leonina]XP_044771007.1 serine/threonine-protein phosphatase CPPED1 isoform X2 [Neomonachus schauinslandi]XP_045730955.1 serine/threonine-protein phosphatase CPPED1 isoform X3 [Mirounga angustirostris]
MSAAEAGGIFRRARGRTLDAFPSEKEREWKGPFYFIQGADPQFGLMKAWSTGDSDSGGDEWGQEIRLTEQAVEAINKLKPKPRFFVLCGDLIHAMPGVTAVFSGHYHRNAGGIYQNLDMVVSSAIGCQLGEDTHGLRVVVVTAEKIVHRYYSLDELSEKGIDDDLMGLMEEK